MQGKIGFIGTGNMGQAIIKGILTADLVSEKEIIAYDSYRPALEKVKNSLGIQTATSENEVVQQANMIILAVKPTMVADVLTRVKNDVTKEKIIVSIAAGKTIDDLSKCLAEDAKIIRVMPNSPALIGQGMSALCINDQISQDDQQAVLAIFASFGQAKVVEEYLMDAVTAVSGAGPAYVYLFIEALADGAVALGMSRKDAYVFAAQTVSGAAQMVLETAKHPGELKDSVTSPGGATMAGVISLENDKFRSAVMNAVLATANKNAQMADEKLN